MECFRALQLCDSAGRYERRTKSTLHDDRAEETSDILEACITSFQSFASVCTFYDPAGQIIGKRSIVQFLLQYFHGGSAAHLRQSHAKAVLAELVSTAGCEVCLEGLVEARHKVGGL